MAFPAIAAADTKTGSQTTNSTSWTLTYPSNLASGDLIIAFIARDGGSGDGGGTWPAGWVTRSQNQATVSLIASKKKSDGTETGNFSVTGLSSEQGVWRTMRIPAALWEGTIGTSFGNGSAADGSAVCATGVTTGDSTTPNPTSLDPFNWGTEDTLFIAAAASDHGDTTYTGFPANYTQQDHATAGGHSQESGGAGGAGFGIAFRRVAASSDDPGTFTTDASEGWAALTVGVRPAAPVDRYAGFVRATVISDAVNRASGW